MKRVLAALFAGTVVLTAVGLTGGQKVLEPSPRGTGDPIQSDIEERNPWTSLDLNDAPDDFHFAVVSDRTGAERKGIFPKAVAQLNLLQPKFVVSVGDLIEGYTEIAKDAKDGTVKVTVTAKSKDSKDSAATVTVSVKKGKADPEPVKDTKEVSLSPDKAPLKLKQGDKGDTAFKVGTKGGAKDAKVAVKGETPKGLKVTFSEIKDGEVKVTVVAADDAKDGDHSLTIEATAQGAAAVSATLTVTVEKKK